jgi:hypothetical protein
LPLEANYAAIVNPNPMNVTYVPGGSGSSVKDSTLNLIQSPPATTNMDGTSTDPAFYVNIVNVSGNF